MNSLLVGDESDADACMKSPISPFSAYPGASMPENSVTSRIPLLWMRCWNSCVGLVSGWDSAVVVILVINIVCLFLASATWIAGVIFWLCRWVFMSQVHWVILVLHASHVILVMYGLDLHVLHAILAYRAPLGFGVMRSGLEARRCIWVHGVLHRIRNASCPVFAAVVCPYVVAEIVFGLVGVGRCGITAVAVLRSFGGEGGSEGGSSSPPCSGVVPW